jgi:hypothetical protein
VEHMSTSTFMIGSNVMLHKTGQLSFIHSRTLQSQLILRDPWSTFRKGMDFLHPYSRVDPCFSILCAGCFFFFFFHFL